MWDKKQNNKPHLGVILKNITLNWPPPRCSPSHYSHKPLSASIHSLPNPAPKKETLRKYIWKQRNVTHRLVFIYIYIAGLLLALRSQDVQATDEGQAPQRRRDRRRCAASAKVSDTGRNTATSAGPQEFRGSNSHGCLRLRFEGQIFAEELRRCLCTARFGRRRIADAYDTTAGDRRGLPCRYGYARLHRRAWTWETERFVYLIGHYFEISKFPLIFKARARAGNELKDASVKEQLLRRVR